MDTQPRFIKEFSKEKSTEDRQEIAKVIRTKRAEYFIDKRNQVERLVELQQSTNKWKQSLAEKLEAIHNLENEITRLSTSGVRKILNYLQIRKLRADIAFDQKTYNELEQSQNMKIAEQQSISEKLYTEETPPMLQEAKTILANFYKEQKEKWARSEYTKEDIIKFFSEEYLVSLSLEDYILLLRRFPQEIATHVTRQWIRDHIGHSSHILGEGKYFDSFMKMTEDWRLRSSLGVFLIEKEKENAIAKFLHLDSTKTKKGALEYLERITSDRQWEAGSYSDRMAIHFAIEEVADSFYGSEQGNEIFVAYPSAHIASQYYFRGWLNEGWAWYWNDRWVWANEERGINLNAGLIFIPEEAKVDKKNGSRYELDTSGNPIINSKYRDAFRRVVDSPDFYDFANQFIKISDELNQNWDNPNSLSSNWEVSKKLKPFYQRLEHGFGITEKQLQMAILNRNNLSKLIIEKEIQEEEWKDVLYSIDEVIENMMRSERILYTEAKDVISSKEFWEAYFAKNPTKKPSKIIYYKGSSPTLALHEWREMEWIYKKTEDRYIGFPERHLDWNLFQAIAWLDRFKIIAKKVIDNYYSN